MKNLILLCFLCFSSLLIAQQPSGQAPKIGTIYGAVIDLETSQAVAYATVTVNNVSDNKLVTGGLTDEDGKFSVPQIPPGEFMIEISFIGYDKKELGPITISPEEPKHDLGTVELGIDAESLDAVVVEGEAPVVRYEVDKKVYDADKIKAAEGGTAKDVLAQIPSVTVNSDQTLQLRGSGNVRVLVNGRPSSFSMNTILEQIPQKSIKSIEIITNPSAKYDAEGEVGIINIILKENDLQGFNGGTNLSWGTENKWNLGANIAYKVNKWNLTANYNFNRFRDNFFRDTEQISPSYPDILQTSDEGRNFKRAGHFAKVGVDYYFNDANTLFLSAAYSPSSRDSDSDVNSHNVQTKLFNGTDFIPLDFYDYTRNSLGDGSEDGYSTTASFQHIFNENMNHNLLVDFNFNTGDEDNYNSYNIDHFTSIEGQIVDGFSDSDRRIRDNQTTTISADYTNPFDGSKKLELGYKSILEDRSEEFSVLYQNQVYDNNTGVFDFKQNVHAGYITYQDQINERVGLKGGLRAEYTDVNSVATGGQNASYIDDYLEWFPSASASFKATEKLQLTTSYSRRVSRPRGRQLNPFADRTDPNNFFVGNNALKPSFTNSIELGFNQFWSTVNLDGSFYYRGVKDQIQFKSDYNDEGNYNEVSFYNLTRQDVYGVETSLNFEPKQINWYSLRLSGNYNYSKVTENDSDVQLNNNKFSLFSGNVMNNFRTKSGFGGQLNLNYQGPLATYIGEIKAMWGLNANVSQRILKNKGSVYIRANDMFNTYGLNAQVDDANRFRKIQLDWPSQMAFIGFNYSFGNMKNQGRRKMERRDDQGENQPNIGL